MKHRFAGATLIALEFVPGIDRIDFALAFSVTGKTLDFPAPARSGRIPAGTFPKAVRGSAGTQVGRAPGIDRGQGAPAVGLRGSPNHTVK